MTDQDALLALNAVPGLGSAKIKLLWGYFGSPADVVAAKEGDIAASGIVTPLVAQNIVHFSKDKFLTVEYNLVQQRGIQVITAADDAFPAMLSGIPGAPVVLYIWGNVKLLHAASVAMVGSRVCSYYGKAAAGRFAGEFARTGLVVVSGLARGIDTAAHRGCLDAGGNTVAVIGCGLEHVYPRENRDLMSEISQKGAVVSEMPMNTPPMPVNFPRRNRIISGLSLGTVVVEAGLKSGALITADYALEQGRDVFAIPANIDYSTAEGSNKLIKDGAKVALCPMDVLEELQGQLELVFPDVAEGRPLKINLSEGEMRFYEHLNTEPVHIDELTARAGQLPQEAAQVMLGLELKGVIRQLPGKFYVKV